MKHLRRLIGILLILAGATGLVLSLMAIRGIHQAATSVATQSTDILDSAHEAVVFLKQGTTKTHAILAETKGRTQALDTTLVDITKKVKDSPSDKAFLYTLDNEMVKQLVRAQATLANVRSTIAGFQSTLVLFNSLDRFSKTRAKDGTDVDDGQDLSRSLTEASENLDHISRFLDEVLTDKEVTLKGLNEVTVWVKQIQGRLAEAEQRVNAFQRRLTVTEQRIVASQTTLPVWIKEGSLFACLLLTCFAFTQIGLVIMGQGMIRNGPPESRSEV